MRDRRQAERERQTETETDRQTDRQTETDRDTHTETEDRQIDRQRQIYIYTLHTTGLTGLPRNNSETSFVAASES